MSIDSVPRGCQPTVHMSLAYIVIHSSCTRSLHRGGLCTCTPSIWQTGDCGYELGQVTLCGVCTTICMYTVHVTRGHVGACGEVS